MAGNKLELLQGTNLEEFSRQVYSRQFEQAVKGLIEILDAIDVGGVNLGSVTDRDEVIRIQTILASAITALICDRRLTLNVNGLSALISLKSHLRTIFGTSAYGDMQHIARLVGQQVGAEIRYSDESALGKYMLAVTLDTADEAILDFFEKLNPEKRLLFWLGCMDSRIFVNKQEDHLRQQLLARSHLLENCSARSVGELQSISRVWMNCSYWNYANKHDTKKILNQVIRNTHRFLNLPRPAEPRRVPGKDRPRLLIICEVWSVGHAMYRCYEHAISSLRDRFHTIGMVMSVMSDDNANKAFEEVVDFDATRPLHELIDIVLRQQADMIYFPSIGMHLSILQLAMYRLAPIQLMTAGHPASSFLDTIDYMVLEEDMISDPETISEKVLLTKREAFTYQRPSISPPAPAPLEQNDTVNIVVSSVFFKISPDFIEVLADIRKSATRPIHFHFLAALSSLNRVPFEKELRKLENVTCYELEPYAKYLDVINQCDMQVAPFPFGNANGFVDAMLVGLPIVCLDGGEIHSHTDAAWGRRVGVPEECITYSVEEYKNRIISFVDNHELRISVAEKIRNLDLSAVLFGEDDPEDAEDFARLLGWVYESHEQIQSDDRHVWSIADRRQAG